MNKLVLTAAAVLGVATPAPVLVAAPAAVAASGAYTVPACTTASGGVNHVLSPTNNDSAHISQGVICPALSGGSTLQQQEQGLYTVDNLGAIGGAVAGASAGYTFAAPANTEITELSWDRFLGVHFDGSWTIGLWIDGVLQPSDTCTADFSNSFECSVGGEYGQLSSHEDLPSLNAHQLFVGVRCISGGCTSGASIHRVWASIYDTTVTLTDSTPPAIGPFTGPLASGDVQTGTQSLSFTVSDSTGIKELDVTLDGQVFPCSPGAQSCDYTNPITWPTLAAQTFQVDTTTLTDGQHTLEAKVINAAGLVSTASQVFTVVNHPSPPPTGESGNPAPTPGQNNQGGQNSGQNAGGVTGGQANAKIQITRAKIIGHCLVLIARLPSSFTGLMTFTVTARHGRRLVHSRRTVRMARGIAHAVIVLNAIERSASKLALNVRFGGDQIHHARSRRATVPVPHARVHHRR